MVLSIEIAPQTEARLRQLAQAVGKDVGTYVSQLVEEAAAKGALDDVLTPLREKFAAMGVTDEELVSDITEAQAEYRASRRKKPA
jgi:hypothetical protein